MNVEHTSIEVTQSRERHSYAHVLGRWLLLARGTAVEDPGHQLVRIVGVPSNLMGAGATIVTAGLGWYLDRRLRPAAAPAN